MTPLLLSTALMPQSSGAASGGMVSTVKSREFEVRLYTKP